MAFKKIIRMDDLPEGRPFLLEYGGQDYFLLRKGTQVFAFDNHCPHEGGPLSEGEIVGDAVICPWHAWAFDLSTGEAVNSPGCFAIKIPTKVEDGNVYLNI